MCFALLASRFTPRVWCPERFDSFSGHPFPFNLNRESGRRLFRMLLCSDYLENIWLILYGSRMDIYGIGGFSRREILKMSMVLAASGSLFPGNLAVAEAQLRRTPNQILGPFYPLQELTQTTDLTRLPGRPDRAKGQVLNVAGKVLNVRGEPVRDAKIEIWQANTYGRYTHPSDTNSAPLDPNFEGSAVLTTDTNGQYRFKTIKPAAYPTGPNTMRPAHIHFQVSGRQDRLVTQMYFEGDPYNETDHF
jgi:protocatechuate 3,4-dioxygenase beta subunit